MSKNPLLKGAALLKALSGGGGGGPPLLVYVRRARPRSVVTNWGLFWYLTLMAVVVLLKGRGVLLQSQLEEFCTEIRLIKKNKIKLQWLSK